tara:strand:+ start:5825 stop:6043 length:219 start_codon:yes stop_codon:yes gene_type:complete
MVTPEEEAALQSLDKRVSVIEAVLHRLENNHLTHMQKDIDGLDLKLWAVLGGMLMQLGTVMYYFITQGNQGL